jgi:hypothetical protein
VAMTPQTKFRMARIASCSPPPAIMQLRDRQAASR